MVARMVELTELLEAFVVEHAIHTRRPGKGRGPTLLGNPSATRGPGPTGTRSLARPAELFLEALARRDFTLTDDIHPEDPT